MASAIDTVGAVGGASGRRRAVLFEPTQKGSPKSPGGSKLSPQRNSDTKQLDEWMKSDYKAQEVADMKLKYPFGLTQRDVTEGDPNSVHNRGLGLPGDLTLDKATSDKYFGQNARDKFFGRYQWLNHQRAITTYGPNDDLRHLYFDNEKLDTNQLVPFGPLRSTKLDDNASQAGSRADSQGSGGSAFRSRFKAATSGNNSALELDKNMLKNSAARSGIRKIDFEDDLAHAEDSFLSFGDVVEVPSVEVPASTKSVRDDWDNVSEVTMAQEELTHRMGTGFHSAGVKRTAAQAPAVTPSAPDSLAVLIGAARSQVRELIQTPEMRRAKAAAPPATGIEPVTTSSAPAPSLPAQRKSILYSASDHTKTKTEDTAEPPKRSTLSYNPATSSLRIKFLTPDQSLPPNTNATAFNGSLKPVPTTPGIASKDARLAGTGAAASTGKSGVPRPSTALASTSRLYSSNNTHNHSAAGSKVTTPRRGSVDPSAATLTPIGTPATTAGKHMRPKTATATHNTSTNTNTNTHTNTNSNSHNAATVNTKDVSKSADFTPATRAARKARIAAKVETSKSTKQPDLKTDTYSKLILEDLLTRKNVKLEIEEDKSTVDSFNQSGSHEARLRGEADSICSASTVSTIGLGLYLDQLKLESLQQENNHEGTGKHNFKVHGKSQTQVAITSPRTKYLTSCMQLGLNPRASLVLRKNMSKQLNLQHHGMGDTMGMLLAESIQGLPHIQSINIADNMLTDVGMGPIILAAVGIPGLLELNLSQNEIGPVSAKALFEYLISPTCPLERLILRNADVDDFECERFVEAIKNNKSLVELDLSNNKIGSAENLNTVMPDLITGGEALAELLRLPQCNLRTLKVDWNMIRLDGAVDFAQSLSINDTLTYLDLSFNSLGTEGGVTLGVSILTNRRLETLILTSNNIDSVACFTICAGVIENRGLKKVVLDGNPIGEQGMKALMLVPMIAGNRVKVSAARCNINIRDPRCWFNFEKLIRDYDLNMEEGYHRAIAIILLHLIAGHHTFIFTKFQHEITSAKKSTVRKIDLIQKASTEASEHFDNRQRFVLDGLLKMKAAASDIQTAIRLFQEVDADNSGELDKSELKVLMSKMGIDVTEKRLTELMNQYDVDQGGMIELHEFLMLLKSQHKEAQARIKELVEAPIMVLKNDPSKPYLPPVKGTLHITVADGFAKKDQYRIMSACDREYIAEVTKDMSGGSAIAMIASSLQGTKMRLDEGLQVAQRMLLDSPDKVSVIRKLVLQMNDTSDARNLITSLLENDRTEMLRLKRDFGASLRPILGNPNGYYVLDLSKEMDRMCLEKLLEISTTAGNKRMENSKLGYGRVGDLSQKGNWSSFRNELLNGEPVVLSPAFAQPIPLSGKLEFDFSGAGRPNRDALVVSDIRVVKILMNNGLLHPHDTPVALYKMNVLAQAAEKTLGCEGRNYYEVPMERARLIGEHVEQFYENLHLRSRHFEQSLDKEVSVAVDANDNLIDLFENEKYPISTHISDFMTSTEILGPVPAEIGALGGAPAPLGRKGKPLNVIGDTPQKRPPEKNKRGSGESDSSDSDSESSSGSDSDGSSSSGSGSRSSYSSDGSSSKGSRAARNAGMAALKSAFQGDDDNSGDEKDDATAEEEDWQKAFEMMKKQYTPKVEEVVKPQIDQKFVKRQNVAHLENPMDMVQGDEFLDKFKELLLNPTIQSGAKAHRIVDMVEDLFARSWIYARHLVLIVECFGANFGYLKQTKNHGTYRVDLIVALFGRVVDLHNFEFVMKVLAPSEVACLYCRLGWLNLYNPCKPEGAWELDMSRREERVIAKTLCVLATNEPGDNWVYNTFRWMRSMDSMPGWELTQPWLTEEGMPMRGLLNITYYSGEGIRRKGCRPYVSFRKSLLLLALIKEEEIVAEDMRSKPAPQVQPGDRAFQKHISLWDQYLCPENVDPNRKR